MTKEAETLCITNSEQGGLAPDPTKMVVHTAKKDRKREEVHCHLLYSDFRLPPPVYSIWLMEKVSTFSSPRVA